MGIDLEDTKLESSVFTDDGRIIKKDLTFLDNRKGKDVAKLVAEKIGAGYLAL